MIKNILKKAIPAAIIIAALYAVYYFCGANIYESLVFRNETLIQVSDNEFRCPASDPENFVDYMEDNGYILVDRLGMGHVFENGEEKTLWILKAEHLFTSWTIGDYSEIGETTNEE